MIAEYKPAEEEPIRSALLVENMVGHRYVDMLPPEFSQPLSEALLAGRRASKVFSVNFSMDLPGVGLTSLQAWIKTFPGGSSACAIRCLPAVEPGQASPAQDAALARIRAQIQAAPSVEEALQVAVRELSQALGGQPVSAEFDPGPQMPE